ncbi:MAG: hypothetical protein HDR20_14525 [Lachnospiraceae bacterium]|nr:hypothetical protein [Lachnospiraceae bacterium]
MRKIKLTKVLVCICIFTMVLPFTACADHTDYDENEEVSQIQVNISEQERELTEEQETEDTQEKTLEASPEAEIPAESEPEADLEAEMMADFYESVEVSELDYDSFQSRMSDEEWEGFQQYFPILKENAVFHYSTWGDEEVLNKSGEPVKEGEYMLYERYTSEETMDINHFTESYCGDDIKMEVEDIRVFDLDNDGVQELIIQWTPVGELLILHCEKGEFYGWATSYRCFEGLQTNGVYISSSGAGANCWKRIRFDDGSWMEEVLLEEDWGEYWVGGEAVDADTFLQQADFYETEEVTRYEPMRCMDLGK